MNNLLKQQKIHNLINLTKYHTCEILSPHFFIVNKKGEITNANEAFCKEIGVNSKNLFLFIVITSYYIGDASVCSLRSYFVIL